MKQSSTPAVGRTVAQQRGIQKQVARADSRGGRRRSSYITGEVLPIIGGCSGG